MFAPKVCTLVLCLASCRPPPPDPLEGLPPLDGLEADPQRQAAAASEETSFAAASHILVSWKGAERASRRIKLDREGARARALHLLRLACSRGQDFAQLAKQFSDDSETSVRGGELGLFVRGEQHPALEEAVFALAPGRVGGPVETPHGFHIVQRDPAEWAQAAEILIAYDGAQRYRPREPRSRKQAEELAVQLYQRLGAGEDFAELAVRYSDRPNRVQGGASPPFRRGSQHAEFEKVVFSLRPGEISPPVETPTGFHLVRRLPIEKVLLRELFLDYGSQVMPDEPPKRTREEALRLADQILSEHAAGRDFAALVALHSDSTVHSPKWYARGERPLALERAAFALAPGGVSAPVDTGKELVLIKRVK